MSDSSDLDEFENFDQELEQMQSEEEVEQRQENRLLSVKEKAHCHEFSIQFRNRHSTDSQRGAGDFHGGGSDPEGCGCARGGRTNR